MMVVCLASTELEAQQAYASRTLIGGRMIVLTGNASSSKLHGLRFTEDDMVCEFPGFRDGAHAAEIIETLHGSIAKANNAGPQWIQITGSRAT